MNRRASQDVHSLLPAQPPRWRGVAIAAAAVALLVVAIVAVLGPGPGNTLAPVVVHRSK